MRALHVMSACSCDGHRALKRACQSRTTAKNGNALDGLVDLDILGRRRRLRSSRHFECFFPLSCNMRSIIRVLRGNPWKGSSLLREEARGVQWSDSNSIAEAVTKARPGGTSSRADEWRTRSVRSDPKLGANDPCDGKASSHSLSASPQSHRDLSSREGIVRRRGMSDADVDGENATHG